MKGHLNNKLSWHSLLVLNVISIFGKNQVSVQLLLLLIVLQATNFTDRLEFPCNIQTIVHPKHFQCNLIAVRCLRFVHHGVGALIHQLHVRIPLPVA